MRLEGRGGAALSRDVLLLPINSFPKWSRENESHVCMFALVGNKSNVRIVFCDFLLQHLCLNDVELCVRFWLRRGEKGACCLGVHPHLPCVANILIAVFFM